MFMQGTNFVNMFFNEVMSFFDLIYFDLFD